MTSLSAKKGLAAILSRTCAPDISHVPDLRYPKSCHYLNCIHCISSFLEGNWKIWKSCIVETAALGHPQFEKHALRRLACSKILEHPWTHITSLTERPPSLSVTMGKLSLDQLLSIHVLSPNRRVPRRWAQCCIVKMSEFPVNYMGHIESVLANC